MDDIINLIKEIYMLDIICNLIWNSEWCSTFLMMVNLHKTYAETYISKIELHIFIKRTNHLLNTHKT